MILHRKFVFSTSNQADVLDFQKTMKEASIPVDVSISTKRHYRVYVHAKHYDDALSLSGREAAPKEEMLANDTERGFILVIIALGLFAWAHLFANLLFKTSFDQNYYFSPQALMQSTYVWMPFIPIPTLLLLIFWQKTKQQPKLLYFLLVACGFALFMQVAAYLLSFTTGLFWLLLPLILPGYFLAKRIALHLTQTNENTKQSLNK